MWNGPCDARNYAFVDSDCDDRDLRIRSRSRLGHCAFSLATASIDSSEKRAEIINRWTSVPEVASAALQAELRQKVDISDPKAANSRREALSSILSIKPLSSVDWLSLSVLQRVTDQPMEQVLGSLKLSMMTGPNEGNVMADRGIFGVSIWDSLSSDLKRRAARIWLRRTNRTKNFRPFFPQNPRVRNEVREALLATGFRRKRLNNDWDFSFAAEGSDQVEHSNGRQH